MKYVYRHYIFDLEGVVANTTEGVCDAYRYTQEKLGLQEIGDEALRKMASDAPFSVFCQQFGLSPEKAQEATVIWEDRYAQVGVRLAKVYPGIDTLLKHLKEKGNRVSIIAKKSTGLARAILRKRNLLPYTHGVFGTASMTPETEADLISACMKPTTWLPRQTLVIGGSLANFVGAEAEGVSFLGTDYGTGDISLHAVEVNLPGEGYWGVVGDSCDLSGRIEEIMEADVTPSSALKDGPVEVSVVITTYNHEKYLQEALDSVLMQKTDFRFEILIGDDASADDTQYILRDYLDQYPTIFRMELRRENLGATKNVYDLFMKAKGKYLAVLEGDDYWTDVHKLQIQYDFMESHPNYSFCSHRCLRVDQNGVPLSNQQEEIWNVQPGKTITLQDMDGTHIPGYGSTQFMQNFWKGKGHDWSLQYTAHPIWGDHATSMLLLLQGNGFCIDRIMACYRRVVKGGTNAMSAYYANPNTFYEQFMYFRKLEDYAKQEFGADLHISRREWLFQQVVQARLKYPNPRRKANVKAMVKYSNAPWKYRGMLTREYCKFALKVPKEFLKKIRNRYHSLLLEKLGNNARQLDNIGRRQNSLEQQLRLANAQLKEMSEKLAVLTDHMDARLEHDIDVKH